MKSEHAAPPDERNQRLLNQYVEIAQLTGVLAHELKNPLSTIRLNMELLAEDLAEDTSPRGRRARSKVAVVERECGRLQSLLDDFLNFVKLRGARLEPSDLNELVTGVLDFFAPALAETGVEVLRYLDPELPSVMLERESFRRAVMNLVLNAQQAMPEGGQLLVRTRAAGNLVALDLIDTGNGIEADVIPHIFEAFYTTKPSGSGLGLPTVQKIIEAHNGRISVESEVGRGTKFTLELPVLPRIGHGPEPPVGEIIAIPLKSSDK